MVFFPSVNLQWIAQIKKHSVELNEIHNLQLKKVEVDSRGIYMHTYMHIKYINI